MPDVRETACVVRRDPFAELGIQKFSLNSQDQMVTMVLSRTGSFDLTAL